MIIDIALVTVSIVVLTLLTARKHEVFSHLQRNSIVSGILVSLVQLMILVTNLEAQGVKESLLEELVLMVVVRLRPMLTGVVYKYVFLIVELAFKRKKSLCNKEAPVLPDDKNNLDFTKLSRREIEVARLAAKGYTNAQIADELYISSETVKRHMSSIMEKLGINSRKELMLTVVKDL